VVVVVVVLVVIDMEGREGERREGKEGGDRFQNDRGANPRESSKSNIEALESVQ
jgi:hypothetical protein